MKNKNNHFLFIILIMISILWLPLFSQERQSAIPAPRAPGSTSEWQPATLYLNPQQEAEVLKYLEEYSPELAERLSRIKESNSDTYREQLSRAYRQMIYMDNLKETDPEQYERVSEERRLELESNQLATQYKNTTDEDEKRGIKAELEDLLFELFDYRQMNRIVEIERLEERLESLKEENQNRLDNKDQIVNNRLLELLGERSGLEW
ncbi:hypothetical protein JW824_01305 [bacterium]|nr:hypothetical protein [bacterium]RQV98541.1 MAG: hypothetical protein EH221_01695 [bacterium]